MFYILTFNDRLDFIKTKPIVCAKYFVILEEMCCFVLLNAHI